MKTGRTVRKWFLRTGEKSIYSKLLSEQGAWPLAAILGREKIYLSTCGSAKWISKQRADCVTCHLLATHSMVIIREGWAKERSIQFLSRI